MARWRTFVHREPYLDQERLYLRRESEDGTKAFAGPLNFQAFARHEAIPREHCLVEGYGDGEVRDFLQAMMDAALKIRGAN